MPYWMHGVDSDWARGLFMLILMVVLWTAPVAVVLVAVRRYTRPARAEDRSLHILNERFARGEIDKDDYEQRRSALQH